MKIPYGIGRKLMGFKDYKRALVTGASSGVGAACLRSLKAAGLEVVAVARREDRLIDLAKETNCEYIVLDLTRTTEIYEQLGESHFDVLINNAGLGRGYEGFFSSSPKDVDEMIELNVSAAIHVVRVVAEGMVERSCGHIVHISSITALYPLGMPVYSATKGAIHSFAQDLRMTLKGTFVRQTEICPGRIETEFFDKAFKSEEEKEQFRSGFAILTPKDIADAMMYALTAPWNVNVSLIELTSIEQIPGGVTIERAKG